MSTYISNGNYMYGISEYDQPCVPYYNDTIYHKKPDIREFSCKKIKDDGYPYIAQLAYPNCCATCNKCNAVNRNTIINNFINIETYIDRILTITLYATTKDKDEIVKMKIGNKYCITYLTENGLQTVTGVFKEVSENVPDECLRYIGNFNSVTSAAYICLDCSSVGSSDKRFVLIADTHIGNFEVQSFDIINGVYDYCVKNNIKHVFHLGDLFDGLKPNVLGEDRIKYVFGIDMALSLM